MIVCSTNCTLFTSFLCCFIRRQFFDKLLRFAFYSPLPIKLGRDAVDYARQIGYDVFYRVLCHIHNFDRTSLNSEKRLDVAKPEAGQAVLMLNDDTGYGWTSKQLLTPSLTPEPTSLTTL